MEDKLIVIEQFDTSENAQLAKLDLEAANIDATIENEILASIGLFYTLPTCSVKLLVRESDAEQARQVLRDFKEKVIIETEDGAISDIDEQDDLTCPVCGSHDVNYEAYSRKWFFLGWFLFRFPLPKRSDRYMCRTCGRQWKLLK